MAEELLNEMINKINQITASLDGTIAQINKMKEGIDAMSQKFSEETVSINENIRLIVELMKQFRVQSSKSIQEAVDDFNDKIAEMYEKKSIEAILDEEKKAISTIRRATKAVASNLYYAQLLTIIRSIREETNRIIGNASQ